MYNKSHLAFVSVLLFLCLISVTSQAANPKVFSGEFLPKANDSSSLEFAQVTRVDATQQAGGSWCFDVSVRHNDQGWDHYANGWEVIDLAGNQLGVRGLSHPHVNEQPFTRSQCNIIIPTTISKVIVRAKCNKHDFGGKSVLVVLSDGKGVSNS